MECATFPRSGMYVCSFSKHIVLSSDNLLDLSRVARRLSIGYRRVRLTLPASSSAALRFANGLAATGFVGSSLAEVGTPIRFTRACSARSPTLTSLSVLVLLRLSKTLLLLLLLTSVFSVSSLLVLLTLLLVLVLLGLGLDFASSSVGVGVGVGVGVDAGVVAVAVAEGLWNDKFLLLWLLLLLLLMLLLLPPLSSAFIQRRF